MLLKNYLISIKKDIKKIRNNPVYELYVSLIWRHKSIKCITYYFLIKQNNIYKRILRFMK